MEIVRKRRFFLPGRSTVPVREPDSRARDTRQVLEQGRRVRLRPAGAVLLIFIATIPSRPVGPILGKAKKKKASEADVSVRDFKLKWCRVSNPGQHA